MRRPELAAVAAGHRMRDLVFELLGLLAMLSAVLVLAALFGQLLIDGLPRLNSDFLLSFPSCW